MVNSAKNLGITFNSTLTWSNHINDLLGKTYGMLRNLWATQHFTPQNIRMLLAKTYLIPRLLYGCEIFAACDSVRRRKLNVLYNNIARYVFTLKRSDRVSMFANKIFQVSFDNLVNSRALITLHRTITTHEPEYLFKRLLFLRSNRGINLVQPRHTCLTSERQFFVHTIRLWNSLPHHIQQIKNATQFKSKLINYFTRP